MPTNRRQGEIAHGLIRLLSEAPDGLLWDELLPRLKARVPPTVAEAAKPERIGYLGPWTTGLVKAKWLIKDLGRWSITEAGLRAAARYPDPEDLQHEWNRLYHLAVSGRELRSRPRSSASAPPSR